MPSPSGKSVFVSYCHSSQVFVRRDLVPVLRAAGAGEVFVDYERFTTGKHLTGQMDHFQDAAEVTLALVTPDYLASTKCSEDTVLREIRARVANRSQADAAPATR